jgi:hypothetical protein
VLFAAFHTQVSGRQSGLALCLREAGKGDCACGETVIAADSLIGYCESHSQQSPMNATSISGLRPPFRKQPGYVNLWLPDRSISEGRGKMKITLLAAVATAAIGLSGCASVIEGTSQIITVNTNPSGADCSLNRMPEGVIGRVTETPAGVTIRKTKYDITIKCNKAGYQEATYLNHSGAAGATFGNIILGGGIGWAVDSASGSDNKYDSPVNITLVPGAAASNSTAPSPPPPRAPGS